MKEGGRAMRRYGVPGVIVAAGAAIGLLLVGEVQAQRRDVQAARPPAGVSGWGAAIGVSVRDLTADEIAGARLPQPGGVFVDRVREGGPAAEAGIRAEDIIVEFDGERVRGVRDFTRLVQDTPTGRTVRAVLLRDGARQTVDVTPEARGGPFSQWPEIAREIERTVPRDFAFDVDLPRGIVVMSRGVLGATLLPLDRQLAEYFGVEDGVLVSSVGTETPGSRAGLRAGDVVTAVNDRRVSSAGDVSRELRAAGSTARLQIVRDKRQMTLNVTLPERRRLSTGHL
jgi:serine protease Do